MNRNFVERFLIKHWRISFSICNDVLLWHGNRRKRETSLISEVFTLSHGHLYDISELIVIYVACLKLNVFVCQCIREDSHFALM